MGCQGAVTVCGGANVCDLWVSGKNDVRRVAPGLVEDVGEGVSLAF